MRIAKKLSFLSSITTCMLLQNFDAYADVYYDLGNNNGLFYSISNEQVTITYTYSTGDIEIPAEIDGYTVTAIGYRAFHLREEMTSISLPEGLVTIEDEAFAGCESLKSIVIPRSVEEIGSCALGYDFIAMQITVGSKYSDFTIYGYYDTAAEIYANENGFTFIALDEQTTTTTDPIATTTTTMTTTVESQTQTSTTTPSTLCGDVNLDRDIDLRDAVLLQKYAVEMVEFDPQQIKNGDCNGDDQTDAQDAMSLMRFLVQMTAVLPEINGDETMS